MKTKKKLKTFLLLLLIALTLSSIFNISMNQNENILSLENIEALAYEECNLKEAKKYCTSAGGVCIYKRQLHAGIHMKAD